MRQATKELVKMRTERISPRRQRPYDCGSTVRVRAEPGPRRAMRSPMREACCCRHRLGAGGGGRRAGRAADHPTGGIVAAGRGPEACALPGRDLRCARAACVQVMTGMAVSAINPWGSAHKRPVGSSGSRRQVGVAWPRGKQHDDGPPAVRCSRSAAACTGGLPTNFAESLKDTCATGYVSSSANGPEAGARQRCRM
jgi:hypothetical protein